MKFFTLLIAILFSLFSTITMSYIAMVTAIGPWIETTLVLCSMLIFYVSMRAVSQRYITAVGLTTAAGGIGGILATAVAFSLPTLFFVAPDTFKTWMDNPLFFCVMFAVFSLTAGSFGLLIADLLEHRLLTVQQMKFPIGELIYNTIIAPGQITRSLELAVGFLGTPLLLLLNRTYNFWGQTWTPIKGFNFSLLSIPTLTFPVSQLPMYIAVGFVTGHVIAIPLLVGFIAKCACIDPLFKAYGFFYPAYTGNIMDFTLAFCSGMVSYGAILSLLTLPGLLKKGWNVLKKYKDSFNKKGNIFSCSMNTVNLVKIGSVISINYICLTYFGFSWIAQLYLLLFSAVCVYQMMVIAGVIGIIPLGRFATFIMVPGMLLFKFDMVQITLTAAFVEIAGGVAGDTLFGRKMAMLGSIDHKKIVFYQWLGLLVSSLVIGIVFWLFIHNLGLGSTGGLPVTKAASRALLINFQSFDPFVLALGLIFGYLITFIKVNPALLLGGILMPPSISVVLIFGGLLTYLTKKSERYYPLFSGISAGNSLWMLAETFLK